MVREELGGEAGAVLASWLAAVDLLILDCLDFGWSWTRPGDRGGALLAQCQRTRVAKGPPVFLTAHVKLAALSEDVDPSVRLVMTELPWSSVAVREGPSLRTGRQRSE